MMLEHIPLGLRRAEQSRDEPDRDNGWPLWVCIVVAICAAAGLVAIVGRLL